MKSCGHKMSSVITFTVAKFKIGKILEKLEVFTLRGMDTQTMEYHLATKRKELLICAYHA